MVHLLNEPSILDDTNALTTIRDIMSVKSDFGKRVSVCAVDIQNGEFVEFNQDNTSYYDFG